MTKIPKKVTYMHNRHICTGIAIVYTKPNMEF